MKLVQTFWPLTTQPLSVLAARHDREAKSLPASGSENPWHHISSPRMNGGTRRAESSGGANSITVGASTSIIVQALGSARSRKLISSPTMARNSDEPPSPPTDSGHPYRPNPASNSARFTWE